MATINNWERFQEPDGSYDLYAIYKAVYELDECPHSVLMYLGDITAIRKIKSRQAAAIAVVTAHALRGT